MVSNTKDLMADACYTQSMKKLFDWCEEDTDSMFPATKGSVITSTNYVAGKLSLDHDVVRWCLW
jgi:hypothetical protein